MPPRLRSDWIPSFVRIASTHGVAIAQRKILVICDWLKVICNQNQGILQMRIGRIERNKQNFWWKARTFPSSPEISTYEQYHTLRRSARWYRWDRVSKPELYRPLPSMNVTVRHLSRHFCLPFRFPIKRRLENRMRSDWRIDTITFTLVLVSWRSYPYKLRILPARRVAHTMRLRTFLLDISSWS